MSSLVKLLIYHLLRIAMSIEINLQSFSTYSSPSFSFIESIIWFNLSKDGSGLPYLSLKFSIASYF